MHSDIGRGEPGIEALGREIGKLDGMAGIGKCDTFGKMGGDAVGERLGIGMRDDDERVHGENSC
jgi:hypothetical protein